MNANEQTNLQTSATAGFTGEIVSNPFHKGITVLTYVNAISGLVRPVVNFVDNHQNKFSVLTADFTTSGAQTPLVLYPGVATTSYSRGNLVLPYGFSVDASTTGTVNYSMNYTLHV